MKRSTSARAAGTAYLLYIATAFPAMLLSSRAMAGNTPAERLATLSHNVGAARAEIMLTLVSALCAFALAVSLYAYTRDEDEDIAHLGMLLRFGEGLCAFPIVTLFMLWLAGGGAATLGQPSTDALVVFVMKLSGWKASYSAYLFA